MFAGSVRVRRVGPAAAVTAALLISGCAAGQLAGTADQKATIDGTNATLGTIALRGLVLEAPLGVGSYPTGSDVALKVVLVNKGTKTETLTAITSPAFKSWGAFASTADAGAVAAAHDPAAASRSVAAASSSAAAQSSAAAASSSGASSSGASSSAASSAAGSSSAASSAAPSSSAAQLPTPTQSVKILGGGRISWGVPEAKGGLLLLQSTKLIYPGTTVPITFTFANAGSITVAVPIALSSHPHVSVIPAPSDTGAEG